MADLHELSWTRSCYKYVVLSLTMDLMELCSAGNCSWTHGIVSSRRRLDAGRMQFESERCVHGLAVDGGGDMLQRPAHAGGIESHEAALIPPSPTVVPTPRGESGEPVRRTCGVGPDAGRSVHASPA